MGKIVKIFLFLVLFNVSFCEEEVYDEGYYEEAEIEAKEEVTTGKSLFFENSNLIRIEMRKDGDKKFGEEKEISDNEDREVREEEKLSDKKGEDKEGQQIKESKENKG